MLAIGALAGALGAGALVFAQSGPGQIQACVLGDPAGANVRIIGPGERCPSGTPVTWNTQGPAGPAGPAATVSPEDVAAALAPPEGADLKTTARDALKALKLKRAPKFKTATASSGPTAAPSKIVAATCPKSHPKIVTGGFTVTGIDSYSVSLNLGSGWSFPAKWITSVSAYGPGPVKQWTLKVSAKCAKP